MRILVHDHSGHPFQVELSRELARRGHKVTHSYTAAYVSGKGALRSDPEIGLRVETVGRRKPVDNMRFASRLAREVLRGFALAFEVVRRRPNISLASNVQIPTLVVFAAIMWLLRRPWILWHQDVYSVAVKSFAGEKLSKSFRIVAFAFSVAERWCARRAAAIVVIAPSFVPIHEEWGTADKVVVIPNWAPLDEIVPSERDNAWAREHNLDDTFTLLYSGTLGLKHDPALMVGVAKHLIDSGKQARLVVVNEGPAIEVIRTEAARSDVPVTLLPYQPYARLPEVLGSGDVLVVLLDQAAGAFSVPSKTLSYLCAGRPILGLLPAENLAADLIGRAGGKVLPPNSASLPEAAEWLTGLVDDDGMREKLGVRSRDLAEDEFALTACADRFEQLLARQAR